MRGIAKPAKTDPAVNKCCGWEEPAICCVDKCTLNIVTSS